MFVLFGFGREKRRDYGPTIPIICPNCHNPTHLRLIEIEKWFSLFFVPILPYDSTYLLVCDVCSRGIELTEEQFEKAKRLCRATRAFREGKISEEKYDRIVRRAGLSKYAGRKPTARLEAKH